MFNSFSFSELLTILVVVVIVFGPHRLPEMARKMGELAARARRSLDSLRAEIGTDYKDVIDPIRGAREDLRGLRQDIQKTAKSVVEDLDEAAADVRGVARKPVKASGTGDAAPNAATPVGSESGDAPARSDVESDAAPDGSA